MSAHELHAAIGQLLVGGFPGPEIDALFGDLVREGLCGGAILFSRNIVSLPQAIRLVDDLSALPSAVPLWIAIDQEGGRVQRLRAPFPELPSMRVFGALGRKSLVHRAGVLWGTVLQRMGIHQNYAPVLDVDSNPQNPVIGDRSFSSDASKVARLGSALIDGLQSAGVAACGKHFPGHGDTFLDSHLALPTLPHDRARLDSVELVPFRAAIGAGVASIMTAHIMFPLLDPVHPATLSEQVIQRILREALQYQGVIVSDDLEMAAIADHYGVEDAAVRAIRAGCDQLLICHQPNLILRAHQAIFAAVEQGTLSRDQIFAAAARVAVLKKWVRPKTEPFQIPEDLLLQSHADLLRDMMVAQ